jgi:iron-sulfur cluster assembly protein
MFTVTPAAAEQILRAADIQEDEPSLRIAAKIDDDGQIVYGMGFDEERENDVAFDCEGVRILISPRSEELLAGATLDFVELQPGEFQFVFNNPNEPTCAPPGGGCGGCSKGSSCS